MKKAAIITLYGNYNYGNKLQNYALQTVLESMGFRVETLVFNSAKKEISENMLLRVAYKVKRISFKMLKRKTDRLIHRSEYKKKERLREEKFKQFSSEYIHIRHLDETYSLKVLSKEYDYFVIGSDQVWNPEYIDKYAYSFASFASQNQRIAYAVSIGTDRIPPIYAATFKRSLQGIKNIFVREEQAKLVLQNQFQVKSTVVLDPTLLLKHEIWSKLFESPQTHTRFTLTYFLNENTKYPQKDICSLCIKNNWKNIDLSSIKKNPEFISGPIEFLKYINGAKLVLTDSFHGTVFSIIFHTPFVVLKRGNQQGGMYRRLEQLLSTFHLEQRQYKPGTLLDTYLTCDFTEVDQILDAMSAESLKYLEDAIKSE